MALLCSGCSSGGTTPASTGGCSSFVLTGHPSYPPVAWADGSTLQGGGIQVVQQLAKDSGVTVRVVNEGSWDDAQLAVREGRADAIVGIYKTPQRQVYLDYLQPALAPDPSSVLIRKGESFHYSGWSSLIGKRGVVGAGESYGPKFDAFLKAKLTTYRVPTLNGVFKALIEKKAQYGLSGYYTAITSAPSGIAIAAPDFVTEGLYLAFGKQSRCAAKLSAPFSSDIARMAGNGSIKRIFAAALAEYEKTHHS
jgi:polar amino acid transport system substrate-binding protein